MRNLITRATFVRALSRRLSTDGRRANARLIAAPPHAHLGWKTLLAIETTFDDGVTVVRHHGLGEPVTRDDVERIARENLLAPGVRCDRLRDMIERVDGDVATAVVTYAPRIAGHRVAFTATLLDLARREHRVTLDVGLPARMLELARRGIGELEPSDDTGSTDNGRAMLHLSQDRKRRGRDHRPSPLMVAGTSAALMRTRPGMAERLRDALHSTLDHPPGNFDAITIDEAKLTVDGHRVRVWRGGIAIVMQELGHGARLDGDVLTLPFAIPAATAAACAGRPLGDVVSPCPLPPETIIAKATASAARTRLVLESERVPFDDLLEADRTA